MATNRHRITVSLPDHLSAVVGRLARLQRRTQTSIVVELLEAAYEPLARTADLLEAADNASAGVKALLAKELVGFEAQLEMTAQGITGQLDRVREALAKGRKDD